MNLLAHPALAAVLLLAGPAPEAKPALPKGEQVGVIPDDTPPPGSKEDLALWRSAKEISQAMTTARVAVSRLNGRAKANQLVPKLEAGAKGAPHEEAERLSALASRVRQTRLDAIEVLQRPWPVDPVRGCRFPVQFFDSALRAKPSEAQRSNVNQARARLRTCVEKASIPVEAQTRVNRAFEAAIVEAEREVTKVAAPVAARHEEAPVAPAEPRKGAQEK